MSEFLGHLGVEDDLELEIAELVLKRIHVTSVDCIGDFVRFLDRIGRDGGERLLQVPFATALRIAEPPHGRDKPVEVAQEGSSDRARTP
jgi:hypothetical protein